MIESPICLICEARADHMVGAITVCSSEDCEREAKRDLPPTPLSDLLARYGSQR